MTRSRGGSASVAGTWYLATINGFQLPVDVQTDEGKVTDAIAKDTDTAPEIVEEIYQQELSSLASEATITQFIGVIATRRVKMLLRKH